jgi:hypothetical protein
MYIIQLPEIYRCYTNCKSVRITRDRAPRWHYYISTNSVRWTADVTTLNLRHHQRTDSRHACVPSPPPPSAVHRSTDCQRSHALSPPKMLARMPAKLDFYSLTLQAHNDKLVLLLHSIRIIRQKTTWIGSRSKNSSNLHKKSTCNTARLYPIILSTHITSNKIKST